MKTKAYKLAAELGLQEQPVLDWLRAHGYPNVRRADTIRADVAQAARRALGRSRDWRSSPREASPSPREASPRERPVTRGRGGAAGRPEPALVPDDGFKVSFAELLERHLPDDAEVGAEGVDTRATVPELPAVVLDVRPIAPRRAPDPDALSLRLGHVEADRAQVVRDLAALRVHGERQAGELAQLRNALAEAKRNLNALEALRADIDRLQLDRLKLRQQLALVEDERTMLEHTCTELSEALDETRGALETAEQSRVGASASKTDLDAAVQREMAWRARALELERASQDGTNLNGLLEARGLRDSQDQVRALRALLDSRESAAAFVRALRNVDAGVIERLLGDRLARICAHPICNQVAGLGRRVVVRVDDDTRCDVCQGSCERRWFVRMVHECARAGVRRLLVIGGVQATHDRLRQLSQGQPVDLRLVATDEPVSLARAQGRVEGCDVLVVWSAELVEGTVTGPYVEAARAQSCPVVTVLGRSAGVSELARAVANRLARNHVLLAH